MRLKKAMENLKYDKRMIDLNIQNKLVTETDYTNHRDGLTDSQANSESFTLEDEGQQTPATSPEELNGQAENNY